MAIPIITERYSPTDWQDEDLSYLLDRTWSANWSEMGCYKTTSALWLLERKLRDVKDNPAVLFITTKSGKGTYYDAIPKSLEGWKVYNVSTKNFEEIRFGRFRFKTEPERIIHDILEETNRPSIFLAHYNCFVNKAAIWGLLQHVKWDFIILDEAHRIKNREAQWTKNIKKLRSEFRHVMTGTGFINDPSELWSLLNFLDPKLYGSYWRFRETYCEEESYTGFRKVVGIRESKVEEFRELRKTVGVRRMMRDVHQNVSAPIFTPYYVELNAIQRKMFKEIKKQLYTLDQKGVPLHSPNVLSMLNRLRQITVATPEVIGDYYDPVQDRRVTKIRLVEPSSKLDALMDILDGLEWDAENKQQVVVFSNFKDPLTLLAARLEKRKIPYIHMVESDNEKVRYHKWKELFPQKEHQVFMCTLQLGSESINLTPAKYGVFLDRSWSPKDNNQGVGRLYRPGQTDVPNIIHVMAEDTTDQYMEDRHNQKVGWFETIFGEGDPDAVS